MSKFKMGDKVRLKADAVDWSSPLKSKVFVVSDNRICGIGTDTVFECVTNYPDDFELAEAAPTPHAHYDMIVEWAANPSRIVQFRNNDIDVWCDVVDNKPNWTVGVKYRFKPVEPERVFPETSLTDIQLTLCYSLADIGSVVAHRKIANAAIKQYILDLEGEVK